LSTLCVWVRVDQRLVFEPNLPPFLTPLAGGLLWLAQLDINLDAVETT